MTLVHTILASVELPPMTGNHLKKSFDLALGQFWTTTQNYIDLKKEEWGEKKIVKQEDQPNRKEYSITKTGRAGLRRGMALPIIGARSLEHFHADLSITGSASGIEPMTRLDQVGQPSLPSPADFSRPLGHDHA